MTIRISMMSLVMATAGLACGGGAFEFDTSVPAAPTASASSALTAEQRAEAGDLMSGGTFGQIGSASSGVGGGSGAGGQPTDFTSAQASFRSCVPNSRCTAASGTAQICGEGRVVTRTDDFVNVEGRAWMEPLPVTCGARNITFTTFEVSARAGVRTKPTLKVGQELRGRFAGTVNSQPFSVEIERLVIVIDGIGGNMTIVLVQKASYRNVTLRHIVKLSGRSDSSLTVEGWVEEGGRKVATISGTSSGSSRGSPFGGRIDWTP